MRRIRVLAAVAFLAFGLAATLPAEANDLLKGKTYHFGTHPARTNITFISEADLETIHGITHAIRGTVSVDAAGTKASGMLRVGVGTLRTGIALRDEHLRSSDWLDVAKHPTIDLQLVSASEGADKQTWRYAAKITIKGITKSFEGTARITAFPDHVGKALGAGSWVRVRTQFEVTLSEFGIKIPEAIGLKVSKTWRVGVDVYGTTAPPKAD